MPRLFEGILLGVLVLAILIGGVWLHWPSRPASGRDPAARAAPAADAPRLAIEAPRQELGRVPAGGKRDLRFPVRNAGQAPLIFHDARSSCGCIKPTAPDRLAPGERGEIRVRFEPPAWWEGPTERAITLVTNDPASRETTLTLAAELEPLVGIEPKSPLRLTFRPGEVLREELRLVPQRKNPVRIESVTTESPGVQARLLPPAAGDPRRVYRVQLTVEPPGGGAMSGRLKIQTSDPALPRLFYLLQATPRR